MKPRPIALFALASFGLAFARATTVKPAVPLAAQPFDLAEVRLGPGPFRDAMQRDRAYLLGLDPDRLLLTFRLNVGLPSDAQPYGGWEGPTVELRGHTLGHYLSACSLMYRSTGDDAFKQRVTYLVTELARCQAASPQAGFHPGYLSAFPESFIDRVEAGKPVWAPWYTLHKIMAGLLDAYQLAGDAQALDVLTRMAGWVKLRVDGLTPEQMQASLKTEFGGMNEVLANLYAVTGDPDHLKLAAAFNQAVVFDPLAQGRDELNGLHANTQIPKMIGAARQFELTGDPRLHTIAETFWDRVALHRSYVIGGDSDAEHFFPVDDFAAHLDPETTETCNTYNMLKLTRHLFEWDPQARTMDFYERALYNHILASQDPARGLFVYLMSLAPGHFKTYSTPDNSFWCCVGTGMENHAKYGDTIFAHSADALYVNLFIAADLDWRERHLRVRQETNFPNSDTTRLVFGCDAPADLALRIRHPAWAAGPLAVTVNGQPVALASQPASYAELRRTWHDGDVVEVRFPMALHTEDLPGDDHLVALLFGPIVLAGKLGSADMPNPYTRDQLDQARYPDPVPPAFVTTGDDWLAHVEMVSRSPLLFRTHGLARPQDVLLAPFYRIQHERYTVYWRLLAPAAWDREQQAIAGVEQQWSAARAAAVDFVSAGDPVSEAAHHFVGTDTQSGTLGARTWREAQKQGSFTYALDPKDARALTLVCAYGSRDRPNKFAVFVNDTELAQPALAPAAGDIQLVRYPVPATALAAGQPVTVRFQARNDWDAVTANVFGCALLAGPP
ncbi:MAG TPA: beta-L-arabinofuranosidase domain-containing protein [Opitutus sp.]|nr:beta-L-arabinofuranosidase domain-containing protein [Opitutus sp.]